MAHFQYNRSPRDRAWTLLFLLTWLAVIAAGAYGVVHRSVPADLPETVKPSCALTVPWQHHFDCTTHAGAVLPNVGLRPGAMLSEPGLAQQADPCRAPLPPAGTLLH